MALKQLSNTFSLFFQNLVTQMWLSLNLSERAELRHFLIQHLLANHSSQVTFVRNKLVKVIVLIGRADWPHNYPEFFAHVQQVGVKGFTLNFDLNNLGRSI